MAEQKRNNGEPNYLYCSKCQEHPDAVKGIRKWGGCEYVPFCNKCGNSLEFVG